MYKLTFTEWLTLLNPLCRLRIVTEDGLIYEGKKTGPVNFEMNIVGIYLKGGDK